MAGGTPQARASKPCIVRDILKFLAGLGECKREVAECPPPIPGHRHSSTPSAYSRDELSSLLADREPPGAHLKPRRSRAIMLLAGVLGMRASDIKGLRLGDIDWHKKTLSFAQRKTQVGVTLPMPEEVWLALADYLRGERPDVDSDRVFITSRAPYRPTDSSHVFHRELTRTFAAVGIDTAGKRHGMRSLRHSAATNMLAEKVPHPVISATLGHSSTNVTRRHLSIDVESLRPIALEAPRREARWSSPAPMPASCATTSPSGRTSDS